MPAQRIRLLEREQTAPFLTELQASKLGVEALSSRNNPKRDSGLEFPGVAVIHYQVSQYCWTWKGIHKEGI